MNDTTKMSGGVPAIPDDFANQLGAGIAESRATTRLASGKPFLRMMKSGDWVFGQTNEEVQPGSHWAVNIMSLAHGWCCWVDTGSKNELKGEVMDSMTRPKPPRPGPIDGTPFAEQRQWIDEETVVNTLEDLGFTGDDIWQRKLQTFQRADAAARFTRDRAPLYKLARSKHWYERRTAITATWIFIRHGDVDDTFEDRKSVV